MCSGRLKLVLAQIATKQVIRMKEIKGGGGLNDLPAD